MTASKLSDSDKQDILKLYRQPGETTSTLASRYSVSNSTINRILRQGFSESEYEFLVQQKRSTRPQPANLQADNQPGWDPPATGDRPEDAPGFSSKRRRRRSSAAANHAAASPLPKKQEQDSAGQSPNIAPSPPSAAAREVQAPKLRASPDGDTNLPGKVALEENYEAEANVLEDILGEDLLGIEDDLDDEDDLDEGLEAFPLENRVNANALLSVLPLSEASLPKTCYLVVDRAAELVARPLKEFGELGQIPAEEIQARTLPVFDNHRVARRFSNRTQRVVKIPDGQMLQKTGSYLQAKGITRLLIDGQVYAL